MIFSSIFSDEYIFSADTLDMPHTFRKDNPFISEINFISKLLFVCQPEDSI
jgi:hypothetical protein